MENLKGGAADDAPRFDLATENELLKLKLKAEFGAECSNHHEHVPHEVINEFLRSVYAFEQQFRKNEGVISIYNRIGKPYFRVSENITDGDIKVELKRMLQCLHRRGIQLNVMGDYPDRQLYEFVTTEFFAVEIENVEMPGFIQHFCYEDFHPNPELEIKWRCIEFLAMWYGKQLTVEHFPLELSYPAPAHLRIGDVLKKARHIYEAYVSFEQCEYKIINLEVNWRADSRSGTGMVEGRVRYDAILESGEKEHVEDVFKIYLRNEGEGWIVCFFQLPGVDWLENR